MYGWQRVTKKWAGAVAVVVSLGIAGCGGSSSGSESSTEKPEPPAPPTAPTNVSASAQGAEIVISWDVVPGADSYSVYYAHEPIDSADNYAAHTGGDWIADAEPPITITADDRAAVYHIAVTAHAGDSESTLATTAPVAPRYDISADGSQVLDVTTNILWERCLHGEHWDNDAQECAGTAERISYQDMITHAQAGAFMHPQRRELQTLVFCSSGEPSYFPHDMTTPARPQKRCEGDFTAPTIYTAVFPQSAEQASHKTTSIDVCGYHNPPQTVSVDMTRGSAIICTTTDWGDSWVRYSQRAN